MSMFIHDNGKFISFKDYIAESFTLKPAAYGGNSPDFDDNYIFSADGDYWTLTHIDGTYVLLMFQKNKDGWYEVGFGTSTTPSEDYDDYMFSRTNTGKALKVFNSLLYIIMRVILSNDIKKLYFNPADPKLGVFYKNMTKNKSFLKVLKDYRFRETEEFRFERY
jgi:hypothetical protein